MNTEERARQRLVRAKRSRICSLALILAMVLLVGSVVGGTLAWLIADTDPVVNTFTYGDIDLELEETRTDEKGNPVDNDGDGIPDKTTVGNEYKMLPGETYGKDPTVTVLAGSEACWLFVKLEEKCDVTIQNADGTTTTYDFDDYLAYEVADCWTQLLDRDGQPVEGVYYTRVGESETDLSYQVLKDNQITVLDTVTKDMLNALDNNGEDIENATYPSLSVTAYAVQYSGFEPEVSTETGEPNEAQIQSAAWTAWQTVEAQNQTVAP